MTTVSTILDDLEGALASRTEDQKTITVVRVTDLFVAGATQFSAEQIGVFDVVIGRLATSIGFQGRVELSKRLAGLPKAPHGVVRQLALDEIGVARPVLIRSAMLKDNDLIAVATAKGRDHMLAITERPGLSTPVTDYLVVKGDRVVSHALAHNETARFSSRGMGLLVTRAIADDALQVALGGRDDIPPDLMVSLSNAARESTRRRLMNKPVPKLTNLEGLAGAEPDNAAAAAARAEASERIRRLDAEGKLNETSIAGFAERGATQEAICCLAQLARFSIHAAEQAVLGNDRDACLVIGKALEWNWSTVKALINLRPASERLPHQLERAQDNYENLSSATANRVIQFMREKEQAEAV